ncbi:MAG: hypothetical protein JXR68_14180 [Bacteroidales bacterium]|nr:hypothetical protein [Bacteroidales bacterium]
MSLIQVLSKKTAFETTEVVDVQILKDLKVISGYVSPFSIISCINLTKNQNLFLRKKNFVNDRSISWIIKIAPNKRFFQIGAEIQKGDILRFKIETLREVPDGITQVMFLTA